MIVKLNPLMVAQQGLNRVDIARLVVLHAWKDWIFERARGGGNPVRLAKELRYVEFAMQAVWKFERDESKHTWKYLMPNSPFNENRASSWVKRYLQAMRFHGNLYSRSYL